MSVKKDYSKFESIRLDDLPESFILYNTGAGCALKFLHMNGIFTLKELFELYDSSSYIEMFVEDNKHYSEITGSVKLLRSKYLNEDYYIEDVYLYSIGQNKAALNEYLKRYFNQFGFSNRLSNCIGRNENVWKDNLKNISDKSLFNFWLKLLEDADLQKEVFGKLRGFGESCKREFVGKVSIVGDHYIKEVKESYCEELDSLDSIEELYTKLEELVELRKKTDVQIDIINNQIHKIKNQEASNTFSLKKGV